MFDRGGDIATLKKQCLKETGLEPPRQPEFQTWALKALKALEGGAGKGGSVKVKRSAPKKKAVSRKAPKAAAKKRAKA